MEIWNTIMKLAYLILLSYLDPLQTLLSGDIWVSNTNKEVVIFLSVMQETLSGCSYMKYGVDADS